MVSAKSETTARAVAKPMPELARLQLLLQLSKRIADSDILDEQLEILIEIATTTLSAERGSVFLNDPETNELYSRIAQGTNRREIRILNNSGIAGHVYTTGEDLLIADAYSDPRFNQSVDSQTGYTTRNIACCPIRTVRGETIGVIELLNKVDGGFSKSDLDLMSRMATQAAISLQSSQFVERMNKTRQKELDFLDIVVDVTSELELDTLLQRVMGEATKMLQADRSTLFLNDEKRKMLFARVAQGDSIGEIRFPNHLGIAGTVFTSQQTINIPHAYADLRFNPAFDKQTGYFTRSILCVPVNNKKGKCIGVTQVLNRHGGPFTSEDETRLKAFTAQIAIALENAKLFEDVQNIKNYNESMLESMPSGVITLDEEGQIITCNAAGQRILGVSGDDLLGRKAEEIFNEHNSWLLERITKVQREQQSDVTMDASLWVSGAERSVNITTHPLKSTDGSQLGCMLMIEDISNEKRVKATMARYMDPGLAAQLLDSGQDVLGGTSIEATVLFSDIRSFTTITETLGAQGTVSLLNEYFTIMVESIQRHEGMLDKFIGDAIMSVFGIPRAHDDDPDRGVRTAIEMITSLQRWNADREGRGEPAVHIGIGLNTGHVVSGNIGSPKRMDYTIIGDGVNLAARLESACKQYGAQILISENTYKQLHGTYRVRAIDYVVVKGKTQPIEIYEVLDYHDNRSFPNMMDVIGLFREGREHYKQGDWQRAIGSFNDILAIHPQDYLTSVYIERCQHLQQHDPGSDWSGIWTMTSK
ncbi:MAG: GAF domain-containing protein [Gammaproteobacteria bacterium]|nr:GAF domain-containing protein [Gammaproteobacteria bacterium]